MTTNEAQKAVCTKYSSEFLPTGSGQKLGLALATLRLSPIYGVRTPVNEGVSGWYIWGGPSSESPDFFQTVHVEHLVELLPLVLSYLALEPGFKFIIDRDGYEDVWRESTQATE